MIKDSHGDFDENFLLPMEQKNGSKKTKMEAISILITDFNNDKISAVITK